MARGLTTTVPPALKRLTYELDNNIDWSRNPGVNERRGGACQWYGGTGLGDLDVECLGQLWWVSAFGNHTRSMWPVRDKMDRIAAQSKLLVTMLGDARETSGYLKPEHSPLQ
ncbi:hypothetical protein Tco_0845018 [Tanacetum coccineum]